MNEVTSRATTTAIRDTPPRFLVLAGACAVVVLVLANETAWAPWRANNTLLADGWGSGAARLALVVWVVAPVVALLRPVLAGIVALVPLLVVTAADAERGWPLTMFVAVLGSAMVGTWVSQRRAVVVGALALVPVLTYVVGWTRIQLPYGTSVDAEGSSRDAGVVTFALYVVVVVVALGVARAMRTGYLGAQRARRLEARADEVERSSAIVDERARLAHDLHDVVAHHVSLIAVRAETAPYTVADLPAEGRTLLAEIAADSRRALDELRSVLGILRRSSDDPGRAPQPTGADIAGLIDHARAAGDQVDWVDRDLSVLPATVGYVAYRVVQEALTNARRHAPRGAAVHVETLLEPGSVTVRVTNPTLGDLSLAAGEGHGLAGMRERVESIGGSLTIRGTDRTISVEARLPLRSS